MMLWSSAVKSSQTMAGKTVLVTGATQGIGLAAAKAIAALGARLVITARDEARGRAAAAEVDAAASTGTTTELVMADFSSMQSIRAAAAAVSERCARLDVLLNNAGAVYSERRESADGLELTFATNHIGYFLFTNLLLELLRRSAPARIVNVASAAHRVAKGVAWDDLERRRGYHGFRVYGETKLMNVLFTRELARRLEGSGVTANCLHPGVITSGFGKNARGLLGWATRHLGPLFLTGVEKGARTSVYLCTAPEVAGVSGRYFARCREARPTRHARDDEAARRLWELSARLVAGVDQR
jgi:NAD(P)-dependent dehydrogenase (short-subunit alcohol dehydrogenase family)